VAELLGTHSYSLDPKGRVSLPTKFRAAFVDGAWITTGQDGCLYVFPRAEWERRAEEVSASPLSDSAGRAFARMFFGSSEEVRLDSQGRVTIPQRLRDQAGIRKEVVVLGVRARMEIWDRRTYERYVSDHAERYRNGSLEPKEG
jgi:MraZ protein